jgi:ubiquinone/menaquinone biosynthesis C-methylase UbiE
MAFSDPEKNIEAMGLHEGSYVADLGAGSGFYSLAAAKLVGAGGRVYAIDVQEELLARIKNTAHLQNVTNLEVIHGDIEHVGGTRLKDQSIDVVIASNVLFQVENKQGFIQEIIRILKSGGRLMLVDWSESFGGMGPQADQVITQVDSQKMFTDAGLVFVNSINAGDHHYGLIFRKN